MIATFVIFKINFIKVIQNGFKNQYGTFWVYLVFIIII